MAIENKTLIVIGGGAAGFFCAINAAKNNKALTVVLLEKTGKLLSKVKISGGGRCNVTHDCFDIVELSKKYPRGAGFLKKAFHHFSTKDTISWFAHLGVHLHTEADGRMFPTTNDSQTIMDCLLQEATKYKVAIHLNCIVEGISKPKDKFYLQIKGSASIQADYVCIATGGYPKLELFNWIKKMHLSHETSIVNDIAIVSPLPSLFTFNAPRHPITQLMGISVEDALIKIKGAKFSQQGPLLITHWGFSGPAVLKLSAFAAEQLFAWNYKFTVSINWIPTYNETALQAEWKKITNAVQQHIANHNPFRLPIRLWDYLLEHSGIDGSNKWTAINAAKQNLLIKNLTNFECIMDGKTTFKEEFVTCGGVDIAAIDYNTMQHKQIPHLYFAGEVLNIDGITGGFNFQNAWTTGFIAAKAIAASCT
jgi:predicted Rossmann fold flavoprotein